MIKFIAIFTLGMFAYALLAWSGQRLLQSKTSQGSKQGRWITVTSGHQLFVIELNPDPSLPTILIETGIDAPTPLILPLARALSDSARVIFYDRFNSGLSRGRVKETSLDQANRDTFDLLNQLSISQPFFYIGYSIGAIYTKQFHYRYPDKVKGMVLIDPPLPEELELPKEILDQEWYSYLKSLERQTLFARIGLPLIKLAITSMTKEVSIYQAISSSYHHLNIASIEARTLYEKSNETDWSLGETPTRIITGGSPDDQTRKFLISIQKNFASQGENAEQITFPNTSHGDFLVQPHHKNLSETIKTFIKSQT